MENVEQEPFVLHTPAHWRALAHPLRLGILRLTAERDMTNEELAKALGVASGKLYFHTRMLLGAGMIALVGTRQKAAITEKLYRATAAHFQAAPPALTGDAPPLAGAVSAGLALYQSSWQEDPALEQIGYHFVVPLAPDRRAEFARRLRALFEEFPQSATAEADAAPVALTVLLHTLPAKGRSE